MRPMTKATPLTMLVLLLGGAGLFGLNAFLPLPIETWFAIAGMLVFAAGLLFGLFAFFRSVAVLANPESRRATRVLLPILTILIAGIAWFTVVTTAIQVKRSMDQRAQFEQEHWDQLHQTSKGESQPNIGQVSSEAAPGAPPDEPST